MGKELFDNIPSKVADLLADVKSGRIGLPDIQRPFVWKDNKVRELLDSILRRERRVLYWKVDSCTEVKSVGTESDYISVSIGEK